MIATQHNQQETLVHITSSLNITRYGTQVNRQYINIVMTAGEKMHQDVTTLYNVMHSLYSGLSYQQIYSTSDPSWQTFEILCTT